MRHPSLSMGESMLLIHAQRTVIYGVVIVSRNLERTNENDGFKMTALEFVIIDTFESSVSIFGLGELIRPNCSA